MSSNTLNQPTSQVTPLKKAGLGQRFFAWLTAKTEQASNQMLDERKQNLFAALSGTVLEIGPGTGANLPYYPAGLHWIGLEPNPAMHGYLREKAELGGLSADLRLGSAEQINVPDASVDAVVSTLVLCSVDSPATSLQEVQRVLRPGGRFIFLEHVAAAAGTKIRTAQNILNPVWKVVADGCHPNRETWRDLEQAGFASLVYEHFEMSGGLTFMTPMIAGIAVKGANR